jgi:hypothetical protein
MRIIQLIPIFLNNLSSAHAVASVKNRVLINVQNLKHYHARRSKCPRYVLVMSSRTMYALSEFFSLFSGIGIIITKITDRHRLLSFRKTSEMFALLSF